MTQKESLRPETMTDEELVAAIAIASARAVFDVVEPMIRERCALIADSSKRHHEKKCAEVDDRALAQSHLAQALASDKIAAAIRNPQPVKDKQ